MSAAAPAPPGPGRRAEAVLVLTACAAFLALASLRALQQAYPYFDDVAYLELGHRVRALGGPVRLWVELFAGRFAESNRHPLYLALLGAFAHPDPSYHREAQALSVALGLLALLSCWHAARRHFGAAPAAAVALFLSVNGTFLGVASRETCEPLLVALWAQAMSALLDGADPGSPRSRSGWWRAGLFSGLAYLTKGTGLFLPATVGIALLLHLGPRALIDRRGWQFGAAYALASSPLWVRNLRLFGSPTYNLNSQYVWIDRLPDFAETFAPHALERLPHGAAEYFAQATPGALASRVGHGLAETVFHLADSMALASPRPGGALHVSWVLVGFASAIVALRWIARRERGLARTLLLTHAGFTFAFLVFFNANGGSGRYFLPLAATTLAPALAAWLAESGRGAAWRASPWVRRAGCAWAAAALSSAALSAPLLPPPGFLEVQGWLVRRLRPGDAYAVDARTHLQPRWLAPWARQVILSASWRERPVPAAELLDALRAQGVRYVVLDGASKADRAADGDPGGRRYLFYDQVPLEADGSLPLAGFPEGTRLAYSEAARPRRWAVLELIPTPGPAAAAGEAPP